MRLFLLVGTLLIAVGAFVFSRGTTWHFGFMIPGVLIAGMGGLVVCLGMSAQRKPVAKCLRRGIAARVGRNRLSSETV